MSSSLDSEAASRSLVLATGNRGKVLEFQNLLAPAGFTILTPQDIGFTDEVEETGDTMVKNAYIKARALAVNTLHPVLADDSGLEVDALGGAPGVYSARYATPEEVALAGNGKPISQAVANRNKLMGALLGRDDRTARFRCVLCYLAPGHEPVYFAGVCEGRIAVYERGEGGFGYDPVFIPTGYDKTFGELSNSIKDGMSHRGQAVSLFLKSLA